MERISGLISPATIGKRTGKSHSFVYSDILPKLDVRKVGRSTMATEESFDQYLESLPRVTFPAKESKAA